MPQKMLYGKMFRVENCTPNDNDLFPEPFILVECVDKEKAVEIVIAGEKIRCPYCNSSKCFGNRVKCRIGIVYSLQQSDIYPNIELFVDFHVMKCIKTEKFFLHELRWEGRRGSKNKCPWCTSPYVEKVGKEIIPDDHFGIPWGMECLRMMEKMRDNPYYCKHCHRTFGVL
jgi:transposase-like protein